MNSMKIIIALAIILLLTLGSFAAYKAMAWETYEAENYAPPPAGYRAVEIGELNKNPAKFKRKKVVITGTIATVCPAGCWFYTTMQDSKDNQVKIDLAYSKFAIPQAEGKKVKVEGTVEIINDHLVIIGERVLIK